MKMAILLLPKMKLAILLLPKTYLDGPGAAHDKAIWTELNARLVSIYL